MALAPSASAVPTATVGSRSLWLPPNLKLTHEQFALVCDANPEAVLELGPDGMLITMTPAGGSTGRRNSRLMFQIEGWARQRGGWCVFDSSTGFRLPDGSVLSPDAAVVSLERWQALSPEERRGFPPLCPDLVVELVSPSDEGPRGAEALRRKMAAYQANGARLGWLLFPEARAAEIWQAGVDIASPRRLEPATLLDGGEVLPGLVLELEDLWAA